jgi:hypothetical protein
LKNSYLQKPEEASASEINTPAVHNNYSGKTSAITRDDGIRSPFGVADTPKATFNFRASDRKSELMKRRFILYRRKLGGTFYVEDTETRKQESLGTKSRAEATSLLNARNESVRQPQLNLQIAKAYLAGTDSGVATRTWQQALDAIVETKSGPTQDRWRRAAKETALDSIRNRIILETQAEHLLACLKAGITSGLPDAMAFTSAYVSAAESKSSSRRIVMSPLVTCAMNFAFVSNVCHI